MSMHHTTYMCKLYMFYTAHTSLHFSKEICVYYLSMRKEHLPSLFLSNLRASISSTVFQYAKTMQYSLHAGIRKRMVQVPCCSVARAVLVLICCSVAI